MSALAPMTLAAQQSKPQQPSPGAPPMKCETGPVERMFGQSMWMVYSCDDDKSLVLLAPEASAAYPFLFLIAPHEGRYRIDSKGQTSPEARMALQDLSMLGGDDIKELIQATKKR